MTAHSKHPFVANFILNSEELTEKDAEDNDKILFVSVLLSTIG